MQHLETYILNTLGYFDIFNYPLKKSEVLFFLGQKCTEAELDRALQNLVERECVYQLDNLYMLQSDRGMVARRLKGNTTASERLQTARKVGQFLSGFPFVKGVGISGSLSKHFADEQSDIDLFIITSANRLWITRTLLHAVKKASFLFRKQHWFCMNYFIDEQSLEIREKNIFTATEIATVMPVAGTAVFNKFHLLNSWSRSYLPNYIPYPAPKEKKSKRGLKIVIEKLLHNKAADWLENRLMKATISRWNRKTLRRKVNARGIIMSMDAGEHYAKPDPRFFQEKILMLYESNKSQLADRYFTSFSDQPVFLKEII